MMIIVTAITAAAVALVGTLVCTSNDGDCAATILAHIDSGR